MSFYTRILLEGSFNYPENIQFNVAGVIHKYPTHSQF